MPQTVERPSHDRNRYQGKNLFRLLLALSLPALLLYLKLVFGIAGNFAQTSAVQQYWLIRVSNIMLAVFVAVQLVCAFYLQGLFPASGSRTVKLVRYISVLFVSLLISITGAMACEAFGYALLLRARRH